MDNTIINCKRCGCKLRLPLNRGMLSARCPKCKWEFDFDSGPKLNTVNNGSQYTSGTYGGATQSANRTITLVRGEHTYKEWNFSGIKNRWADRAPVHIYLDDRDQGSLPVDRTMTIRLDGAAHTIKYAPLGTKYQIPAGTDSYRGMFFNNAFMIGLEVDPFLDALTDFSIRIFRSQGIKDRMMHPNNQYHAVEIRADQDGILLSWRLNETKGLKQWLTGAQEEKISYVSARLMPPPKVRQPDGYWSYVNDWIKQAIELDEEADVEKCTGGFRMRTMHNLY